MTGSAHSERPVPWALLIISGLAMAILVSLGTWQVKRLHWKEGLLAAIDERTHLGPVPLADVLAKLRGGADIDYIPVSVEGRFDHSKEQFFFATHRGQSGYFVYTPLEVAGSRQIVFINRGFVPFDRKDAATRAEGQVARPAKVIGLARNKLDAKPSFLVPDNDPAKNIFYWKDLAAMTKNAGFDPAVIVPLFIDANDAPNPGGLPQGGVTLMDLPNNHLQYAITWYGLAAALAGVVAVYLVRRRNEASASGP